MRLFGKYMCLNFGNRFKTGCFEDELESEEARELYDDICPNCGAPADETLYEWLRFGGLKVRYNFIKNERTKNGK